MKPIDIPHYNSYTDSMVAFVDVLGFDKDARGISSEKDFYNIAKLLFSFEETAKAYNKDKDLFRNLRMTTMSDSIVVSVPYEDPICTLAIVAFLHQAQYDLLATDHQRLLRGYIAHGRVYHDNGIIFGEGFSKAYEGESYIGHAPRIVIDPDVIEDARSRIAAYIAACSGVEKHTHIFDYLRQDPSDGLYFIDYLKLADSQTRLPKEVRDKERIAIGNFIQSGLQKFHSNLNVHRKYRWLESYYQQAQQIASADPEEASAPQS